MTAAVSALRAAARLGAFVLLSVFMIVAYSACLGPLRRWRRPLQVAWSKGCYALAGITVRRVRLETHCMPSRRVRSMTEAA